MDFGSAFGLRALAWPKSLGKPSASTTAPCGLDDQLPT
jgi:hypothetical protein